MKKMKKMKKTNHNERDDFAIRLFIFLLHEKGLVVRDLYPLKINLYVLKLKGGYKVIKGFRAKRKLLFQFEFTQKLSEPYQFETFPNGDCYVVWNNYYWALTPFIFGNKVNFTLSSDQIDTFQALRNFHHQAAGIQMKDVAPNIRRLLPYYEFRFQNFMQVQEYLPNHRLYMFEQIKQWGMYALVKLSEEPLEKMEKQAVLNWQWIHGDVAHHNFIRTKENGIVIIDFDLVSIGPKEYDYLQLAQRMLCCNQWNVDKLFQNIPNLKSLSEQNWFLHGLIFPNDIFREWNHLFRKKASQQVDALLHYTEKQFAARLPFIKELKHMLN